MTLNKKYRKIVVLDSVTLSPAQWKRMNGMADEVKVLKGVELTHRTRKEIVKFHDVSPEERKAQLGGDLFCGVQMTVPKRTKDELVQELKGADCIVTCWTPIPNNVILELQVDQRIRHIAAWTNFVQGRVDTMFAEQQGIEVSMIPGYGTDAVAQYVVALIYYQMMRLGKLSGEELELAKCLSDVRCIEEQKAETQSMRWRFERLKRDEVTVNPDEIKERTLPEAIFRGHGDALKGKTLGIVGFGRIGQKLKEITEQLGMIVRYFSKREQTAGLEEIFSNSDFVSLNLPPCGAQGLITSAHIELMRQGSMLINTSVGNVIADQKEMFRIAREKGVVLGLDVYTALPDCAQIKKTRRKDENLIIATYRNGWYTRDALLLKGDMLLKNLEQQG